MKLILRLFPRPLLIKLSIWFRPLLKFYFKGTRFIDPIDGSGYRTFLPYGYDKIRTNALCPGTLSLERHRLLWLYLSQETNLLTEKRTVLHFAPEQIFYTKFRCLKNWDYTTVDLYSSLADVKADICSLPFSDNSFDLIICNHVLEHIVDDTKAMSELYRVLRPKGIAILQVPLDENRTKTFEDDKVTNPKKRTKLFGQYDHVRIYGLDYYQRLENVGFSSESIDLLSKIDEKTRLLYGLPKEEKIPVVVKN